MPNPVNSKSVVIKIDTYNKLLEMKKSGQSIDDVIRELLELPQKKREVTLEQLAHKNRCSIGTIQNSIKYTIAVDTIALNCGERIKNEILEGRFDLPKRDIIKLSNLHPGIQRDIVEEYFNNYSTS